MYSKKVWKGSEGEQEGKATSAAVQYNKGAGKGGERVKRSSVRARRRETRSGEVKHNIPIYSTVYKEVGNGSGGEDGRKEEGKASSSAVIYYPCPLSAN